MPAKKKAVRAAKRGTRLKTSGGRSISQGSFRTSGALYKVQKVSVALGEDVLAWARKRADQQGLSLSAVLTETARLGREEAERRARQDAAWEAFVDWATEGAGLPASEVKAAEQELYGPNANDNSCSD